jgi:hypothetical protein
MGCRAIEKMGRLGKLSAHEWSKAAGVYLLGKAFLTNVMDRKGDDKTPRKHRYQSRFEQSGSQVQCYCQLHMHGHF